MRVTAGLFRILQNFCFVGRERATKFLILCIMQSLKQTFTIRGNLSIRVPKRLPICQSRPTTLCKRYRSLERCRVRAESFRKACENKHQGMPLVCFVGIVWRWYRFLLT
jgi:hypothetical protein